MKVLIARRQPPPRPRPHNHKTCIFVTSCRNPMGDGRRQICLDTWLSKIDTSYFDWFFVVGDPGISSDYQVEDHMLVCRAVDDWWNLIYKTYICCKFAYQRGYDFICKADDDTYVNTNLLRSRIEGIMRHKGYDVLAYMLALQGNRIGSGNWFPAGPLYALSRRAVKIIIRNFVPKPEQEDVVLGKFLSQRQDIFGVHDRWFSNLIPAHATSAHWEPQRVGGHFKNMGLMYEVHQQLHPY